MMKVRMGVMTPFLVAAAGFVLSPVLSMQAQQAGENSGPPKYIYLSNVVLKPGSSAAYVKLQSEENAALRAEKINAHHFGMWSVTGNENRVLYFYGTDSFADLQKMHDSVMGNAAVRAVLDKNEAAEGQLVQSDNGSIYEYEKDLSLNSGPSLEQDRFMDITLFHLRQGQGAAFRHLAKVYLKAYESVPGAKFVFFQKMYGQGSGDTYIMVTPLKSLADVDTGIENDKTFVKNAGPDLLAMLRAQGPEIIESAESNLFAFGPKLSYVPDSWMTNSPDFWGQK